MSSEAAGTYVLMPEGAFEAFLAQHRELVIAMYRGEFGAAMVVLDAFLDRGGVLMPYEGDVRGPARRVFMLESDHESSTWLAAVVAWEATAFSSSLLWLGRSTLRRAYLAGYERDPRGGSGRGAFTSGGRDVFMSVAFRRPLEVWTKAPRERPRRPAAAARP